MAIHKSAKKRIRRNARVTEQKKSRTSQIRSSVRKVEDAIKSGDAAAAKTALIAAESKLTRGANKSVMHKKTAARKVSRLVKKIKTIQK